MEKQLNRVAAIVLALIMVITQMSAVFAGIYEESGLAEANDKAEFSKSIRERLIEDQGAEEFERPAARRSSSPTEEKSVEGKQVPREAFGFWDDEKANIVPGQMIVKYKAGTTEVMKSALNAKVSAVSVKSVNRLGLTHLELPKDMDVDSAIDNFKDDPNVEYVEPVYVRRALGLREEDGISIIESVYGYDSSLDSSVQPYALPDIGEPYYIKGWQWGLEAINVDDMWADVTEGERSEVTIAIIDTGVDIDHEEFEGNIVDGYDFVNHDNDADDDSGHGTHVAGIAAAAHDGKGIEGVAGGAKIMPVKVLDNHGDGNTSLVINGILFAVNNGADIINLSLGFKDPSRAEEEAIRYALDRGVTVVAAAGNERGRAVLYPAAYDGVIAVGAVDWDGENEEFIISDFSSIGTELDLLAPGVDILSAIPEELDNSGNRRWTDMGDAKQDGYTLSSGTSMAAPFVAGMAALLSAESPNLDCTAILVELQSSSLDFRINDEDYHGDEDIDTYVLNGNMEINGSPSFHRFELESSLEGPGMRRFTLCITDYKDTVAEAVYGEFELIMGEFDYQDGLGWVVEPHQVKVIDVVDGVGTELVEIEMDRDYILYVEANDEYLESDFHMISWDENEDFNEAVELDLDAEVVGSIGTPTDEDYYEFYVHYDGYYLIESTGETDTYGVLIDDNDDTIAMDDNSGQEANFRIQFDEHGERRLFLNQGRYYVIVGGYESGDYGITVRRSKSISGSISLPDGVSAEGDIYIDICLYAGEIDVDEDKFDYEYAEYEWVEILSGENSVDYEILAYEGYDQIVGYYVEEYDPDSATDYSFDYAYSGYYSDLGTVHLGDDATLLIGEADNIDMTLIPTSTLEDEVRNTFEEAAPLQLGVAINGTMNYDGDYDLYKLSVTEEGNYLIRAEEYTGSYGSMSEGYLYNSSGGLVSRIRNYYSSNEGVLLWSSTYSLAPGIYYYEACGSDEPFNSFEYKVTAEKASVISGLVSLPGGNTFLHNTEIMVIAEDQQGNEYIYSKRIREDENNMEYAIGVPASGGYIVSYYINDYYDELMIYAREGYYSSTGTKLSRTSATTVNASNDKSNINIELINIGDTAGDSKETAKQISTGVVIKGNINSEDDRDYYKFNVPQGGGYYNIGIEAEECIGVYFYDNGNWIFYDEGDESYSGGFLNEGTHYLMVRAEDERGREHYELGEYAFIVIGETSPRATSVSISGSAKVGSTLTGRYVYSDDEYDVESGSTFRWLRSNTAGGTYTAISGATSKTYKLTDSDLGKYIKFEVTPRTTNEPSIGSTVTSSAIGPVQSSSSGNSGKGGKGGKGGGGSGSGGGGSSSVADNMSYEQTKAGLAVITKQASGKNLIDVRVYKAKVDSTLKSKDKEQVVIDVKTKTEQDKLRVSIPLSVYSEAAASQKSIVVHANDTSFAFQPDTFARGKSLNAEIELEVTKLTSDSLKEIIKDKDEAADELTFVFDFNLWVNGEKITDFKKPVTISVKFDTSKVTDFSKVGGYYYNEKDNKWEYVGGRANADGTIAFTVDHFSKFAAMEYKKTFTDISGHWAKADIEYLIAKHIVRSENKNSFAPDSSITRAEFASMIVKALNIKGINTGKVFEDIPTDVWYKEDVYKAFATGIIGGVSITEFAPDELITREQMASMVMRAYEYSSGNKLDGIVTTANVRFTDESVISTWAIRNVVLANATGIITGNPDGTYNPMGNTTKAQASVVIKRLMGKLNKL